MSDPTTRTLRLLSLLQRRRCWRGDELADRLEVSDRTLRRDIDRLRELGYTVESERGVDGGYRLAGTVGETMLLLLDDDECTALAAALHTAACSTSELAEAALGALTKVLAMSQPDQRRRAQSILAAIDAHAAPVVVSPSLDTLDKVASACRDQVRLSFTYVSAAGVTTSRYVEAHQLVTMANRWYLVAYDPDRADWRTFRLDRITAPSATRNPFPARPAPAADLRDYVRDRLRSGSDAHHIVIEATADAEDMRRQYGRWITVEPLESGRCRLTMDTDTFEWPTHVVAGLEAPFEVVEPEAFDEHLRAVAERLRRRARSSPVDDGDGLAAD